MPSKIQLDENLWFLYICLQNSDLKAIDFNAVGAQTSLKAPAARMRYTRLRRQIESGTMIGTHGTPFTGGADKIKERMGKRKRTTAVKKCEDDDDDDEGNERKQVKAKKQSGSVDKKDGWGDEKSESARIGTQRVVKTEEGFDAFESENDDFSDSELDSEDEMPLAKLRKGKLDCARTEAGDGDVRKHHLMCSPVAQPGNGSDRRSLQMGGYGTAADGGIPRFAGPMPIGTRMAQGHRYGWIGDENSIYGALMGGLEAEQQM